MIGVVGSTGLDARRKLRLCGVCTLDGVPVRARGQLLVLLVVLGVRGGRGAVRDELLELLWPDELERAYTDREALVAIAPGAR